MSQPLEHDYIGLSDTGSSVSAEEDDTNKNKVKVKAHLNLKETELRLGLPGSESPERRASNGNGISLSLSVKGVEEKSGGTNGYVLKNFMTGAKRGFSDVLVDGSGSGKWGFSGNGGSDAADLGKNGGLFSPRNGLENGSQQNGCTGNAMKDGVPASPKSVHEKKPSSNDQSPPAKAQVVGWPPIRSFRKNTMASNPAKNNNEEGKSGGAGCLFVKVSMDGAPYLRKVDLKTYSNYMELSAALKKMFSVFTIGQCSSHGGVPGSDTRVMDLLHGSECVLTFEDKDGDWMLVGDVPWDMFIDSCKRLRIMKGSEAIGLAPRAMEKSKTRN